MTSTPAPQPVRTNEARPHTSVLIIQLRASHADLLALPVPSRLIGIVERFPRSLTPPKERI
jgi:hypothetical protein